MPLGTFPAYPELSLGPTIRTYSKGYVSAFDKNQQNDGKCQPRKEERSWLRSRLFESAS